MNYYDMLGVTTNAGRDEIKSAYRRLANRLHPDRNPGDARAEAAFKLVNEAYGTLKDPARRAAYDRSRREPVRVHPSSRQAEMDALLRAKLAARARVYATTRGNPRHGANAAYGTAQGESQARRPAASPPPVAQEGTETLAAVRDGVVIGTYLILFVLLAIGAATGNITSVLIGGFCLLASHGLFAVVLNHLAAEAKPAAAGRTDTASAQGF